jgi:RNA polymerase sigma factor (sigma-70 family)
MSDAELVRQALDGRADAYEELAERWSGRVTALCHARVGRPDVADELAQEALLRGFRDLATLVDPARFGPWLCGIARHVCLDWLKSPQNGQVPFSVLGPDYEPDEVMTTHPATEESEDREDDLRRLMAEVEARPEAYREVIMLYYYSAAATSCSSSCASSTAPWRRAWPSGRASWRRPTRSCRSGPASWSGWR